MVSTKIANLALSHLGIGKQIGNINERSQEAIACRLFFDPVLEIVLRDFAWPFATKISKLALVQLSPNSEWDFCYQYPSDCLMVRRILSGARLDSRNTRVPYRLGLGQSGSVIFCDTYQASLEYTSRDILIYPPDFSLACSLKLAHLVAPRVTGGDPFKMGDRALNLYNLEISKAFTQALNEEQPDEAPDSEFILVRD